jgi:arabinose-5-phosphate isomerase
VMTVESLDFAKSVIQRESTALAMLEKSLDESFLKVLDACLSCVGRVILSGIGKSGFIARKVSSTLCSIGITSTFLHPTEASHGDMGALSKNDIVIVLSKSGESPEFRDLLNYCRRSKIPVIAVTARKDSTLSQFSAHIIQIPDIEEACPLGLAPTTSSVMMLAVGDALAMACLEARKFRAEDFRQFHPGGKLGQILLRAADLMQSGDQIPLVHSHVTLKDALVAMSKGRLGCVGVTDTEGRLTGIFTDGDLRRNLSSENLYKQISCLMTINPHIVSPSDFIVDIINLFSEKRIPSVFVCIDGIPCGVLHIHDIINCGVF